jgi:hypothetical protein
VSVKAAPLEQYLFGLILPILDHPYLREAVRSEDEQAATEAQKLVLANSQDEAKLSEIGEMFADDEMDHQTFVKQSQRLRSRIEARETQLASLRGRTALSRLRDNITMSDWDGMSGEDRRSIIQSVVGRIEIGKANKPGSHKFDPDRVSFGWGSSKVARSRGKFVMAQAKNA